MGQQFQGSPSQPYNQGLYNTALTALGPSAAGKAATPGLYGSSQGLYSTLQQLAAIGLIGPPSAPPNPAIANQTGPYANAGGEGGQGGSGNGAGGGGANGSGADSNSGNGAGGGGLG